MTGEAKPSARVYKEELERLERQVGHDKAVEEIIGSIPYEEPDRDRIMEAIREATRFRTATVQKFFPDQPNPRDWKGERPSVLVTEISERGFFSQPKTTEKYGSGVIKKAVEVITNFSAQKAGVKR